MTRIDPAPAPPPLVIAAARFAEWKAKREGRGMARDRLRVVVLHGAHGGPDTNWFPWLHDALHEAGMTVLRPRFPTPQGQSLQSWLAAYDDAVKSRPANPVILVGHSLGAALALRLAERAGTHLAGLFLAAPFLGALGLPEYDPINRSFFAAPFDWPAIRARAAGRCGCWAGADDPYVPLPRSQEVADALGVVLSVVPGGGHLNEESGFRTFPALRDAILALAG